MSMGKKRRRNRHCSLERAGDKCRVVEINRPEFFRRMENSCFQRRLDRIRH